MLRRVGNLWEAGQAALGARLNLPSTFQPTKLLWSRGLALLCDCHGGIDFVRKQRGGMSPMRLMPEMYEGIKAGDLVWVRAFSLPQFISEVLPHIHVQFGLVTGDEDWAIPTTFQDAERLLENSNLVCWFAQNYDGTDTSGKIFNLPIGLDFHTISNGARWGHMQATPAGQEAELNRIRAAMPANRDRMLAAHTDFHFNKHPNQSYGDRREVVEVALRANAAVTFQRKRLPRTELWIEKTRFAFVVSPHGNGLDCHRTWESLALGNIVIVKRSSLDPLYQGLPVVIVDEWDEIAPDKLSAWHAMYQGCFDKSEVQERLTNRYWISWMRGVLQQRMESVNNSV